RRRIFSQVREDLIGEVAHDPVESARQRGLRRSALGTSVQPAAQQLQHDGPTLSLLYEALDLLGSNSGQYFPCFVGGKSQFHRIQPQEQTPAFELRDVDGRRIPAA